MAEATKTGTDQAAASKPEKAPSTEKKARKDVPGNFSYSGTPNRFKDALDALIGAERPPAFNRDFIETVLNIKGGSVSGFPPILKRLGFLNADNSPTELYGQFQADSSRSYAALTGLKNGFGELFKRNAHVHKADDNKIRDYLVQITGRKKDDQVVSAILGTFNAVRSFITDDTAGEAGDTKTFEDVSSQAGLGSGATGGLGLSYHINIVLPETSDVAVLNAIFRSLRENLLRD